MLKLNNCLNSGKGVISMMSETTSLMIKDNLNTQEQLAEYLKIGILCYKYTHDEEIFFIFCRYLYYYSWYELEQKFDFF